MSDSSDYAYLGNQDAGTNGTEYNSLIFVIRQELARLSTASVVKVVRAPYSKDGNDLPTGAVEPVGYIDVQPLVNQIDGYGNAIPHGVVYRIPYHRSQGGGNAIINDPKVGDIGKMVVADRDTSTVRATDKQGNPGSRRMMDKADGTYVGRTQADKPNQWVTFTNDGIEIHDKNGNSIVMGPDGIKIKAVGAGMAVDSQLLSNTGGITAGKDGSDSVTLQHHVHAQGNDTDGDGEVPVDAPTPGT